MRRQAARPSNPCFPPHPHSHTLSLLPNIPPPSSAGVGLNTKAGTAHFIRSLAQKGALSPSATATAADSDPQQTQQQQQQRSPVPQLLKALRSAVASERSQGVKKAYAAAAAAVAAKSSEKRLGRFVSDAVGGYGAAAAGDESDGGGGSGDEGQRLAGALLLRELMRVTPDGFNRHASEVRPQVVGGKWGRQGEGAIIWDRAEGRRLVRAFQVCWSAPPTNQHH